LTQESTILGELANSGIKADVERLMTNDALSYHSMLTILRDAAVGGMTASKFDTLKTLASLLDAPGGVKVSGYVKSITRSVVDGDPANATWTGGSSTPVAFGNLRAGSTQAHTEKLIGKWFLGTDLPDPSVASLGQTDLGATYQLSTNPLYGPGGAPSYLDVNQGYVGDCYFMASIGEVALQDPSGIEAMIRNDHNGSYGVRFIVDGHADWVTVNDELPTLPADYSYANGSRLEFANGDVAWPELLEKGYAELNAEPDAPHGAQLNAASNSYAGISAGSAYALTEITGQAVVGFGLDPAMSAGALSADAAEIGAAWSAGQELLVGTAGVAAGNIVADHMFEVTGYNAAAETLTLHNPWGSGYSGPLAMNFTESLAALAGADCTVFATSGKAMA
jgi:hypothetical protein